MARLARVDVIGGRPGRGEGRGDLAADMAGFPHPGDNDAALGVADQLDRGEEWWAEPVRYRVHQHGEPVALGCERAERGGDGFCGLGRLAVQHGHGRI